MLMHGIIYLLRLVSMTLTLMPGRSGSAKAKIQCGIISTTKQTTSIKLATTVGHFFFLYVTLTLKTFIWLGRLVKCSCNPRTRNYMKMTNFSPEIAVLEHLRSCGPPLKSGTTTLFTIPFKLVSKRGCI